LATAANELELALLNLNKVDLLASRSIIINQGDSVSIARRQEVLIQLVLCDLISTRHAKPFLLIKAVRSPLPINSLIRILILITLSILSLHIDLNLFFCLILITIANELALIDLKIRKNSVEKEVEVFNSLSNT
jgi:hypothetical protein